MSSSSLPTSVATTHVVCFYHMLDFRSKARQQLLAYYFTNPTARHHLRDLAARLSIDPSNLSKELGRLESEGLFRSEMSGRQKYFQLNRAYPLFNEVRKIVAKTIGAAPLIAQSLKRIEGMDEAYLYGSFASNQQDAASDIDVLVIGSPREEDLAQAVEGLSGNWVAKSTTPCLRQRNLSRAALGRMRFWKTSGTISVFH